MVRGRLSVVRDRLSVDRGRLSVVRDRLSVDRGRLSVCLWLVAVWPSVCG